MGYQISADTAREQALQAVNNNYNTYFDQVMKDINTASHNGLHEIDFPAIADSTIKENLKTALQTDWGYEIELNAGEPVKIKWPQPAEP